MKGGSPLASLRRPCDFKIVRRGRKLRSSLFSLNVLIRSAEGPMRVGIVVSKKFHRRAVQRNRMKRRLREAFRLSAGVRSLALCQADIVVVADRSAARAEFSDLVRNLDRLMLKAFAAASS